MICLKNLCRGTFVTWRTTVSLWPVRERIDQTVILALQAPGDLLLGNFQVEGICGGPPYELSKTPQIEA